MPKLKGMPCLTHSSCSRSSAGPSSAPLVAIPADKDRLEIGSHEARTPDQV